MTMQKRFFAGLVVCVTVSGVFLSAEVYGNGLSIHTGNGFYTQPDLIPRLGGSSYYQPVLPYNHFYGGPAYGGYYRHYGQPRYYNYYYMQPRYYNYGYKHGYRHGHQNRHYDNYSRDYGVGPRRGAGSLHKGRGRR